MKRPTSFAIIPARDKPQAAELAHEIQRWLQARDATIYSENDLEDHTDVDVMIVLGGDGLLMHMAHTYPGLPILGINFGTVGFLTLVERADWKEALELVLAGEFETQDGPTLAVLVWREGTSVVDGLAVNDVVIRAGFRMVDTELYIDRRYVNTYPGDGMIVASPQGSTAYCMAAGGPVLTIGVRGFAVTPLSPHSPIRSTLVVPEESRIEMTITNDRPAQLILDGQVLTELRPRDIVEVTRGRPPFRMIALPQMNFFEALRTKFNYQIRPSARPSLGDHRG